MIIETVSVKLLLFVPFSVLSLLLILVTLMPPFLFNPTIPPEALLGAGNRIVLGISNKWS